MNGLTIGKLAKKAGIGIETVRFYERQGLIAEPPRTASNYRLYPENDADRLRFIKKAKNLGFTLNEIKELLSLRRDPQASKADVKQRTLEKIKDIQKKIHDLNRMKEALETLAEACDGHGPTSECPILEALEAHEEQGRHQEE